MPFSTMGLKVTDVADIKDAQLGQNLPDRVVIWLRMVEIESKEMTLL